MSVGLLVACLLLGSVQAVEILNLNSPHRVPGEFIVVFNESVSPAVRASHWKTAAANVNDFEKFHIEWFSGYHGKMDESYVQTLLELDEVAYVEAVTRVWAYQGSCTTQTSATWGLDRISERELNLDMSYPYPTQAGAGVTAYIIDTGILTTHTDFGSRATWGTNTVNDGQNTDCNGHGTHVAGTVAGTTWGVAKLANLVAVKVLGCSGSGTNAGVISGINWAASDGKGKKAVGNMSLGGGISTATDAAVKAAVDGGMTMVVAAGNSNADACNYSPARAKEAITVGSTAVEESGTTEEDLRSYFSNYGTCTDIFAPGSLIQSAWIGSNTATRTISGTSMASPHVCGVAALVLGANPTFTPAQIEQAILAASTPSVLDLDCASATNPTACGRSPNKLVYSSC